MLRDIETAKRKDKMSSLHALPLRTLCIDSAPGSNSLAGAINAFTIGIKSPFALYPIYFLLIATWTVLKAFEAIFRPGPIFIDKIRSNLVDMTLLAKETRRLYIYSEADEAIRFQDVESHIEEVRLAGAHAVVEKYKSSPHVAHMRTDGDRYLNTIQNVGGLLRIGYVQVLEFYY